MHQHHRPRHYTPSPTPGSWSDTKFSPNLELFYGATNPLLLTDGTVLLQDAYGPGGTGKSAIYNVRNMRWIQGPSFPAGLDVALGPAAVEPNGNVLLMASPGIYQPGAQFFEWNGASPNPAPPSSDASEDASWAGMMLVLPTGQILLTDGSETVEIYTPPAGYRHDWAPRIIAIPGAPRQGSSWMLDSSRTYKIVGLRFNGVTQGSSYGIQQTASNYPLLRISNRATGHIFYCLTHDHSSMGVDIPWPVSTDFDMPSCKNADASTIETGPSRLEVVTNGIPSDPEDVTVY
jgi:hypothetical protein